MIRYKKINISNKSEALTRLINVLKKKENQISLTNFFQRRNVYKVMKI